MSLLAKSLVNFKSPSPEWIIDVTALTRSPTHVLPPPPSSEKLPITIALENRFKVFKLEIMEIDCIKWITTQDSEKIAGKHQTPTFAE